MPKAFPEKPVPALKYDPLLKVTPEADPEINRWAPPVKVMLPLTDPVAAEARERLMALVPLMFSSQPEARSRSVPFPPAMVRVAATPD